MGLQGAVSEPRLQLEQGHGFFRVVQLAGDGGAGAVAGDAAAGVDGRYACFAAEYGDDAAVDVAAGDGACAVGEEEVDLFSGAFVGAFGLAGAECLPGVDGLSEQWVDRLRERRAGLVSGHVQEADGVPGEDLRGARGDGIPVVLPADASQAQARDLVAALAGEEPGQCDGADQFHGVDGTGFAAWDIVGLQVQSGPQQFRPDVVGDYTRSWADWRVDAARQGESALGVEPAWQPTPSHGCRGRRLVRHV